MNADDPLDAVLNAWQIEDPGDITEGLMARVERDALLTEMRSLRAEMRAMYREMAALRAELAALCQERMPGKGNAPTHRGERLLPFAPPADALLLLG